jgi:hypothetical protein
MNRRNFLKALSAAPVAAAAVVAAKPTVAKPIVGKQRDSGLNVIEPLRGYDYERVKPESGYTSRMRVAGLSTFACTPEGKPIKWD